MYIDISLISSLVYAYSHSIVFIRFAEYPIYSILLNNLPYGTESKAYAISKCNVEMVFCFVLGLVFQ